MDPRLAALCLSGLLCAACPKAGPERSETEVTLATPAKQPAAAESLRQVYRSLDGPIALERVQARLAELGLDDVSARLADGGSLEVDIPPMDAERASLVAEALRTPGRLELRRIDDEQPLLAKEAAPPEGVERAEEHFRRRTGTVLGTYLVTAQRPDERAGAAEARLRTALEALELPAERELLVGPVLGGKGEVRAYLAHREVALDNAAIAETRPGETEWGIEVRIKLTGDGRDRFLELTQASVERRIAFVVDGSVLSAPIVMEPIPGGQLVLSLGTRGESSLREAMLLAAAVRSPLPRLELVSEALVP